MSGVRASWTRCTWRRRAWPPSSSNWDFIKGRRRLSTPGCSLRSPPYRVSRRCIALSVLLPPLCSTAFSFRFLPRDYRGSEEGCLLLPGAYGGGRGPGRAWSFHPRSHPMGLRAGGSPDPTEAPGAGGNRCPTSFACICGQVLPLLRAASRWWTASVRPLWHSPRARSQTSSLLSRPPWLYPLPGSKASRLTP